MTTEIGYPQKQKRPFRGGFCGSVGMVGVEPTRAEANSSTNCPRPLRVYTPSANGEGIEPSASRFGVRHATLEHDHSNFIYNPQSGYVSQSS